MPMIESQPESPQHPHPRTAGRPDGVRPESGFCGPGSRKTCEPPVVAQLVPPTAGTGEPLGRFGHNRFGILATLFLVSGIVGLPLLLLSPAFTKPEKGFWTVAIVVYTAIVFSLFGGFLLWAWNQLAAL